MLIIVVDKEETIFPTCVDSSYNEQIESIE
jgi:hypothetical protein